MRPYHSAALVKAVLAAMEPCPCCKRPKATVAEVAKQHHLSRDTVYQWVRAAATRELKADRKQGMRSG